MIGNHGIQSLAFRIQTGDEQTAFSLRSDLLECWSSLLPEFERGFDQMASGEALVHIPRLCLSFRVNHASSLFAELPGLLSQALRDISHRDGPGSSTGVEQQPFSACKPVLDCPESSSAAVDQDAVSRAGNSAVEARVVDSMEVLKTYLATGRLPWFARTEHDNFEPLRDLALARLPALTGWCSARTSSHAWFRLLVLLPSEPVRIFVRALVDSGHWAAQGDYEVVSSLVETMMEGRCLDFSRHQRTRLAATVLYFASADNRLHQSADQWQLDPVMCLSPDQWSGLMQSLSCSENEKKPLERLCAPLRQSATAVSQPRVQSAGHAALMGPVHTEPSAQAVETVLNAGAVLFHSHLPALFRARGVEVADGRIPQDLLDKAAALLCYLVCGREDELEFRLDVIKIMLGLAPDWPLPLGGGLLDDEDKMEVRRLLDSMLAHWSALKGTTVEGLRSTFLQRPGLLRQSTDADVLKIERTGADILLDHFPYPFSVVKLPWMPKPIYVEW